MTGERRQILVFSYHRSGTTLFERVMRKLAARLNLRVGKRPGQVWEIDPALDIVLLPHALLGLGLSRRFVGVRVVRDPRDIWVSGYFYHQRCNEGWCVNTHFAPRAPIRYPQVDFSIAHRAERFKRDYLRRLGGRSYQQNLRDRDRTEGLDFERANYADWTCEAMRAWRSLPDVIDVRLEDVAADFDAAMQLVFRHLGFDDAVCEVGRAVAATEDVARMSAGALAANPHIGSGPLSKWRGYLSPGQVTSFERRHGALITALGYPLSTGGSGRGDEARTSPADDPGRGR